MHGTTKKWGKEKHERKRKREGQGDAGRNRVKFQEQVVGGERKQRARRREAEKREKAARGNRDQNRVEKKDRREERWTRGRRSTRGRVKEMKQEAAGVKEEGRDQNKSEEGGIKGRKEVTKRGGVIGEEGK